jgi:predicted ATPase
LRGIAERGALAPLFIVATTRPEFRPPWSMRSHHGTISLAPLDRAQVRDMVAELSARHALPRDVVEDVAARTGGVPLFVEEVTRLLLERGEHGGGIEVIPPTLQQSLMARLDRLGPAREVAQIGSVIGRGFSYGLLRDVAGMADAALQAALEKLAEADIVLVQGLPPDSDYRFKHALIQDAAYENLLKSRRQVLHRRVAEILRDRFADTAAAEPEALAYHFTQAGLTDAAIEWWGKAGDQALRRSAFQEAISHLGKAIEMADKAGEAKPRAATATARTNQRLKLQTSYGQALLWSRGFAAEETKAAFNRAQELAAGVEDPGERFSTYYGVWANKIIRGEVGAAREIAERFRREAEQEGKTTEAASGCRILGLTCLWQGDFVAAQAHLEEALRLFDPEYDRDIQVRFGQNFGATATVYLAQAAWVLGDIGQARQLIDEAVARALESAHMPTQANVDVYRTIFEMLRGDAHAVLHAAEALLETSRAHSFAMYAAVAAVCVSWARARLRHPGAGLAELRQALGTWTGQGNKLFLPLAQGLIAELEAEQGAERALSRIDAALALAGETGEHLSDALLHRIRGEILLKRDPANMAPAEEAFLTAIAIAQQQKARSFELRAALSLAKLYQNTNRAADAHAVLAPALAGFAPTPEFPEIAEAQTLLAALAETDEVKNAAAARQRRLKLQTSYGQAVMWSKGFGAEETKAAFARTRELAEGVANPAERYVAYYGQWANAFMRGEFGLADEAAEMLLREADSEARMPEAATAHRMLGYTRLMQGALTGARTHLEQALRIYDPRWDRDDKLRLSLEPGPAAMAYLALTNWLLGEVGRARELIDEAVARAVEAAHVPTLGNNYITWAMVEMFLGDTDAILRAAKISVEFSREHGLGNYLPMARVLFGWARARLGEREAGMDELRQGLAAHTQPGNKIWVPFFQGYLAEIEAGADSTEGALVRIGEALALAVETGEHVSDAFLHRLRGEILLKRDPANTAPAEEAFLTAITIAQQQKAKSFELQAALALAKLYQSTNRPADAHAVLAPALEGFAPTPEFPEIEEAQTLLAALADADEVKNAAASRQRRLKLQTSYGQAMLHARGYSAPETTAAFARARKLTAGIADPAERFSVYFGLWAGSFVGGDLAATREITDIMLAETKERPDSPEACTAIRLDGNAHWMAGDFITARDRLERALAMFDPERDADLVVRFAQDVGVATRAYLALALWPLGEVNRARKIAEEMMARATQIGHVGSIVYGHSHVAALELMRLDPVTAGRHSEALVELARAHEMPMFAAYGAFYGSWSRMPSVDREIGLADMRAAIAACRERGIGLNVPRFVAALAEAEAQGGELDAALASVNAAIAEIERDGQRWSEAEAHRVRGEILCKRDPADTAPAEEAFLAAIAIAQQQKARSFELRAALSLAKLYQSTGRAADAHAILAPALEGFAPTPEFPEIAEAQTLLSTLAATDEVKNAVAARQRRLKLQTSYGQALLWSKGFSADETKAAFTRAKELAAGNKTAAERFASHYGLWIGSLMRGELRIARESAETFLREAENGTWLTEAAVAHRNLGMTCLFQGDFAAAKARLEQALRTFDPERDRDAKFRFGLESGAGAATYLALTGWLMGEVGDARQLFDEAVARAVESAHPPTLAIAYYFSAVCEIMGGDAAAAKRHADKALEISREHGLAFFLNASGQASASARARLGEAKAAALECRQLLADYGEGGHRFFVPFYEGLLAEVEVEVDGVDGALTRVDAALAVAGETGEHWTDALLHRIRGEILLKRDPANTAPAEEAFLSAIAIAQQQKARSFELRAALSLARLCQSTGRAADAHAVLAPALEGFAPTPEFPEIAEAQTLLASLGS